MRTDRHDAFRPEVQGLRAVAVGLVVLFHLWPRRLPGGYVGVDVFFVISGYLITQHLLAEVVSTGTLRVTRFWARRIRRLLPASLLVLALSAVAVAAWAPATTWSASGRQIAASAMYVQNWALARDAVDYLARDNEPTVAQHYWSLSVEEQFYAVWPLLVLVLLALARARRRPDAVRRTVGAGLGVVVAASLAWSAWSTAHDQALAYLSTFTRVWEFGAGALTATLLTRLRGGAVLGWAGLAAIVLAGFRYDGSSPFPGWIALLPVLGTVAVLTAAAGGAGTAGWWLSRRPATFVGDVSYSVYLVHWPLLVLLPYLTGEVLHWPQKVLVLGLTLALAWLSTTFVENPLRTGGLLGVAAWRPFAFAAAGVAVLLLANTALSTTQHHRQVLAQARAAAELAAGSPCLGPGSLAQPTRCRDVGGDGALVVPTDVVSMQSHLALFRACQQTLASAQLRTCHVGATTGATRTVALVGDSHAGAWVPMMDALGRQLGWDVVVHTKGSCPVSDARRVLPAETGHDGQARCEAWNRAVDQAVLGDPRITGVFVAAYSSAYTWTSVPGHPLAHPSTDGFRAVWARWTAAGKSVFVLTDVPRTAGGPVPACLALHAQSPQRCAVSRSRALPADAQVEAARTMDDVRVHVLDLTSQFCDARRCYARIGDVVVYRDRTHLSVEYARLLAPYVRAQLVALGYR
jgi:peptidoglycan/LPS O-acetylase OafA/YrhL